MFVVKGETSRSHDIDEKGFHEKLCARWIRAIWITFSGSKLVICLKTPVLRKLTMDQGNLINAANSSAHTVIQEQHAPDEHREIASLNTNNEFNRAFNEEDIDFDIPGVPLFYSETITWSQRSRLDSENREPPESAHSSTRSTQSQSFSQESKQWFMKLETSNCVNYLI